MSVDDRSQPTLSVRQAAFIGVGAMVGAGITALFATAGATNAGLYPAAGLCEQMATTGQFPACSDAASAVERLPGSWSRPRWPSSWRSGST